MLLLKKHLVELVRAGRKRQTIRFWARPMVKAGGLDFCPGLGRIFILRVEPVARLADLTAADAIADGFASRRALLAELTRLYGRGIPRGKQCFRVVFFWPVEAIAPVSAAAGRKRFARKVPRRAAVLGVRPKALRRQLRDFILHKDPHRRAANG